jgi:type I restriction enzyme S subunit
MSAVPKLRFPEFNVPLEKKNLGKLFSRRTNKGNENLPVYSVTMTRGLVRRDAIERNIGDDAKPEQNFLVTKGDIAYNTMRMWQGAVGLAVEDGMVSPAYVVLSPNEQTHSTLFSHWFKDARMLYRLWAYSYGLTSDRLRLYYDDFAKISVWVPSLPEQQKIASFLSSVDKNIDLLRQKKDALDLYKKGLMQKIFSQEVRFKKDDGSDFPDWEEVALGDVASVTKGKQLNRDTLTLGAAYPVINGGVTPSGYHDEFNTKENSITISEGGNSCGYVDFQRQKFWCGGHCYLLEPTGEVIDKKFAFQSLKYCQEDIMRLRVGSGLPNIQKGDLLKLAMVIPPKLDEQRKIASFLSAIDAKIQNTSSQIEQMETFKKGLLQQMFV